jgi:Tfp pilus assembly PilM family ATPase
MVAMNRHAVIGLDIGRASVKAVQVTLHDKGPRLDGCVQLKRSSGGHALEPSEAEMLLRVMERRGMTASQVVLVAPTDALVGGSMNVPPADTGVSREKILEMELSRTHSLSPGSFEMAWWDLPAPSSGSRIGQAHAVGLPHAAVEATLDVVAEYGLEIVRTVPGSLALLAAAIHHPVDPRCIAAAIDIGSRRGHLVLMTAGRVVHERALPDFDLKRIRDDASEILGINADLATHALARFGTSEQPDCMVASQTSSLVGEAVHPLAEEIGMSFAYVSHLYPEAELGQLLLTGGGANIAGLDQALATSLELDVHAVTPVSMLHGSTFGQESKDPALCMAMGAALCAEVGS